MDTKTHTQFSSSSSSSTTPEHVSIATWLKMCTEAERGSVGPRSLYPRDVVCLGRLWGGCWGTLGGVGECVEGCCWRCLAAHESYKLPLWSFYCNTLAPPSFPAPSTTLPWWVSVSLLSLHSFLPRYYYFFIIVFTLFRIC